MIFFAAAADKGQDLIVGSGPQEEVTVLPGLIDQSLLGLALLCFALFAGELLWRWRGWWCRWLVEPDLSVERLLRAGVEPGGQGTQPLLPYGGTRLAIRLGLLRADLKSQFGDETELLDRHRDEILLESGHIRTDKLAIWIAFDLPPGCIGRI